MDNEIVKMAGIGLNMALTMALWVFNMSERKRRVTTHAIKDLEENLKNHEKDIMEKLSIKANRIAKVEADLKAMPERSEIVRVHERMDSENKALRHELAQMGLRINEMSRDINLNINESARETNLLLGKVTGQLEQLSNRLNERRT